MRNSNFIIFPYYIKYVGLLICVVSLILIFVHILSGVSIESFLNPSDNIQVAAPFAIFILGAALVTFSKEKAEDELTNYLRIKAFLFSIIIHTIYFLIFSFTSWTVFFIDFPSIILMDSILLIYIIAFYIYKYMERIE